MRQHATTQNSIPNNLRVRQSPMPPTKPKDTNKQRESVTSTDSSASSETLRPMPSSEAAAVTLNSNSITPPLVGSAVITAIQSKQSRVKDSRDAKTKRNEWRITKMVLAIFLSFVCCYLPITLSKVLDADVKYPTLHILGYILLYLSACINPIIYVIMNKQYRQAYKTVIMCRSGRLFGLAYPGSSGGKLSNN